MLILPVGSDIAAAAWQRVWTWPHNVSRFVSMNARGDGELRRMAKLLERRDIPRVGWPTMVLPPHGVRVTAIERAAAVTVVVTNGRHEGTARLDLETREALVSATGRDDGHRSSLRRLALEYVTDRNDFDERCGLNVRPDPPTFDEHDPDTWTEMQLLADVTDSDWYPPPPSERSPAAWAVFYDTAHRFNDRFTTQDDAATTPHPTQPQAVQSSADPATPDPSTPAAE